MFSNPIRLANIFMVLAALALCVSACTPGKTDFPSSGFGVNASYNPADSVEP